LLKAGHLLACCPINITEVYAGLRPRKKPLPRNFCESQVLSDYAAGRSAGRLTDRDYGRRGTTLNLGDVMIAAVGIENQLTLLTDNVKDFPMEGFVALRNA
jgi:predicted nucleic acid-binding protein